MFKYELKLDGCKVKLGNIKADAGFEKTDDFVATNGIVIKTRWFKSTCYGDGVIYLNANNRAHYMYREFPNPTIAKAYYDSYKQALEELAEKLNGGINCGEHYCYTDCDGIALMDTWTNNSCDNLMLEHSNVFPEKDGYTVQLLLDNHVPNMSKLMRMAFKFNHEDWMSDEERLSDKVAGYYAFYNCYGMMWEVDYWQYKPMLKWYKTEQTAQAFADYLNEQGFDHNLERR